MGDQHCRGGGEHGRKNHVNSAHWHTAQSSDIQLSTLRLVCNNACKRYMHKKNSVKRYRLPNKQLLDTMHHRTE